MPVNSAVVCDCDGGQSGLSGDKARRLDLQTVYLHRSLASGIGFEPAAFGVLFLVREDEPKEWYHEPDFAPSSSMIGIVDGAVTYDVIPEETDWG